MIVSCTDQGYILLIWLWRAVELTLKITLVLQLNFESSPWHMAFLDTEMKELGRSNQQNIHYTRSLARVPQVCLSHFAHRRSFHDGRIHTHTHTHTYTHIHIQTLWNYNISYDNSYYSSMVTNTDWRMSFFTERNWKKACIRWFYKNIN